MFVMDILGKRFFIGTRRENTAIPALPDGLARFF